MYIQAQDLMEVMSERSLIELSNDGSRATAINQAVLDKACQYASELVDGYLRSRYITPLNQVPTIIRNICLQLARYFLYSRRPEGKGFPENVQKTYEQALKDLQKIQDGRLHLGLPQAQDGRDSPEYGLKFKARANSKLDLSGY